MSLDYQLLDVFTDTPLAGNQLAVFAASERPLASEQMQALARELNIAESVFLEPAREGGNVRARIFTPLKELPFAGHPTLGTAVIVGASERRPEVRLELAAGIVAVTLDWSGKAPFGRMVQPQPSWRDCEFADRAIAALGSPRLRLEPEIYANGPEFVIVVLEDEDELAALVPDLAAVLTLGDYGLYAAAQTAAGWEVRMFAPAFGILEDPATGSGAGLLATHLARHGLTAFGQEIVLRQGIRIGRPATLHATAHDIERVEVGGAAVLVGEGRFTIQRAV
jgi:trans-2,3-dihydro-3-hydroxyanthranilate isomerase